MESQSVITAISEDDLFAALGDGYFPRTRALVMPIWHAQREAISLIDERAAILGDMKLTPEERAKKLEPVEAALRQIVMDASTLTALYSLPHASLVTLSASVAKGGLSATVIKEFLARTDRWSGSFLPETLKDWSTALGMPASSSKKQILARLVELDAERKARDKDRCLNDLVSTFSVHETRVSVAHRRYAAMTGASDAKESMALVCLVAELKGFLALAAPRPGLFATTKQFRVAQPLCLLTAANGRWQIEP